MSLIPEDVTTHGAWHCSGGTHFINRTKFPANAKIGDTCMLPRTTIFLCIGPQRWRRVGRWSPALVREVMHRVQYLDTGREVWRWVVDVKPREPTEGCMEEVGRASA